MAGVCRSHNYFGRRPNPAGNNGGGRLIANPKLRASVLGILLAILSIAFFAGFREGKKTAHPVYSAAQREAVVFASPGRVEGLSETTEVGAATDGVLKAIYVKEDQFVKKGTLIV